MFIWRKDPYNSGHLPFNFSSEDFDLSQEMVLCKTLNFVCILENMLYINAIMETFASAAYFHE